MNKQSFRQVLLAWVNDLCWPKLSVSLRSGVQPQAFSVDLDSQDYVGTVTYWPMGRFEFQFNSCRDGSVTILTTKNFDQPSDLMGFLQGLEQQLYPC